MNKIFKITVLVFTTIFVIFSAMFGVLAAKKVSQISLGEDIYVEGISEEDEQIGMVNILLIGVDEGGMRSDTIMLFSIDGYSNRLNLLSIPRDTMVKIAGYQTMKINALMGVGVNQAKANKIAQPEEILIKEIKKMTNLPIHYFMTVDFDGFKDIINAVDGIDFNVPYDMNYDDPVQNLHIHLRAGQQHLDGQGAHDFVRFRHNNDGSAPGEYVLGDEGREYWQQEFLKELLKQKCNAKYISKISDLFKAVKENVRTNYTMKDLLKHMGIIKTLDINNVGSYQIPGESVYSDGVWWYKHNSEKTNQLISDVFLPKSQEEWDAYLKSNENDNRRIKEQGVVGQKKATQESSAPIIMGQE